MLINLAYKTEPIETIEAIREIGGQCSLCSAASPSSESTNTTVQAIGVIEQSYDVIRYIQETSRVKTKRLNVDYFSADSLFLHSSLALNRKFLKTFMTKATRIGDFWFVFTIFISIGCE